MTAGLPGVGIGGLFYLISALLMPVVEAVRTVRGRSSLARWRTVGRQFAMAVVMVGALTAVVWALHAMTGPEVVPTAGPGTRTGVGGSGGEAGAPGRSGFSPLLVMASWLMLTVVLGGTYVLRLVLARRRGPALAEPVGR